MRYRVRLNNTVLGSQVLEKEPIGLTDLAPILRRGENHGFTLEVDVKLKFYCGAGKEFIDQVRDEQGIDAEVQIFIDQICGGEAGIDAPDYSIDYSDDYGSLGRGTADWEVFYEGVLSLKTWREEDSEDGLMTLCDIDPAGIVNTVKNRLDTKVDLFATESMEGTPLEDLEWGGYPLNMHSKVIQFVSKMDISDEPDGYTETGSGTGTGTGNTTLNLPFNNIPYDDLGAATLPTAPMVGWSGVGSIPVFFSDENPSMLFQNTSDEAIDINVTYNLQGTISEIANRYREYDVVLYYKIAVVFVLNSPVTINSYGHKTLNIDEEMSQVISDSGTLPLTLPPAYGLFLYLQLENYDTIGGIISSSITTDFTTCELNVSQDSITSETQAEVFAVFETGAQIARVITDQEDAFRSSYFGRTNSSPYAYPDNGCGSFRAITNGFMIRGFPHTGEKARTIKLSMNDYFKGLNAIDNLGMGIEKIGDDYFIVVDKKSYFYDVNTTILTLDNVPNIKRYELADRYYNRVLVGYESWESEFTNGLDEFNSKRQYDTGIKSINNELNIISELVASGYRIELARRMQYVDQNSEDSQYDEENFIICLSDATDYIEGIPSGLEETEKDENFSTVSNVISSPTSYNLRLSPARNLLRWSHVINAGLTKYAGREIKFTSGEGNYKAETALDGDCPGNFSNATLSEGQNIQWDDPSNTDQTPIWVPEGVEFGFPITKTQHDIILTNPKGVIEFSETDSDHEKFFILEYKYVPDGVSIFKLLKAFV